MDEPLDVAALVRIDAASVDPPPYDQLRRQLHALIRDASLVESDRLPPVRALATSLGLAANTVARAYRELERDGLLVTAGRAGTRVGSVQRSRQQRLAEQTRAYVARARELGCSAEEIRAALASELD